MIDVNVTTIPSDLGSVQQLHGEGSNVFRLHYRCDCYVDKVIHLTIHPEVNRQVQLVDSACREADGNCAECVKDMVGGYAPLEPRGYTVNEPSY